MTTRNLTLAAAFIILGALTLTGCSSSSTPAERAHAAVDAYADRLVAGDAEGNEMSACEGASLSYVAFDGGAVEEVGEVTRDERYDDGDFTAYRSTVTLSDAELASVDIVVLVSEDGTCIDSVGT